MRTKIVPNIGPCDGISHWRAIASGWRRETRGRERELMRDLLELGMTRQPSAREQIRRFKEYQHDKYDI